MSSRDVPIPLGAPSSPVAVVEERFFFFTASGPLFRTDSWNNGPSDGLPSPYVLHPFFMRKVAQARFRPNPPPFLSSSVPIGLIVHISFFRPSCSTPPISPDVAFLSEAYLRCRRSPTSKMRADPVSMPLSSHNREILPLSARFCFLFFTGPQRAPQRATDRCCPPRSFF